MLYCYIYFTYCLVNILSTPNHLVLKLSILFLHNNEVATLSHSRSFSSRSFPFHHHHNNRCVVVGQMLSICHVCQINLFINHVIIFRAESPRTISPNGRSQDTVTNIMCERFYFHPFFLSSFNQNDSRERFEYKNIYHKAFIIPFFRVCEAVVTAPCNEQR